MELNSLRYYKYVHVLGILVTSGKVVNICTVQVELVQVWVRQQVKLVTSGKLVNICTVQVELVQVWIR